MATQHGEIVKDIGGGFTIAWDTTHVDKVLLTKMRDVARQQSAELLRIIDDSSGTDTSPTTAPEVGRQQRST